MIQPNHIHASEFTNFIERFSIHNIVTYFYVRPHAARISNSESASARVCVCERVILVSSDKLRHGVIEAYGTNWLANAECIKMNLYTIC